MSVAKSGSFLHHERVSPLFDFVHEEDLMADSGDIAMSDASLRAKQLDVVRRSDPNNSGADHMVAGADALVRRQRQSCLADGDVSSSGLKEVAVVTFPWYAVLLLRVFSTLVLVALFQSSFNWAVIMYTWVMPSWSIVSAQATTEQMLEDIWLSVPAAEFYLRNTDHWLQSMQRSAHQFLLQIALFV
jgi:hypothetical protein